MTVSRPAALRISLLMLAAIIVPACKKDVDGPAPAWVGILLAKGGNGGAGDGGDGDYVYIYGDYIGGDVKVLKSGTVDASPLPFSWPGAPFVGANPKTATTATLTGAADISTPFNGDDGATRASGLIVPAGVTLTIDPNDDTGGTVPTKERVWLDFIDTPSGYRGSVLIYGTLIIGRNGTTTNNAADVYINCGNFLIAPGGSLVINGTDVPAGTGGNGGYTEIHPDGDFVNAGFIDGTGGDGIDGGDGNDIYVYSSYVTVNSGTVNNTGGTGSTATGGDGGYIDFESGDGPFYHSGSFITRGGNGATAGGSGDSIYTYTNFGSAFLSGDCDSSGGNCTGSGNGGNADYIDHECYYGEGRYTGYYTARGGSGGPTAGDGGAGDYISIYQEAGDSHENDYIAHELSVNIAGVTSGGDAPAGNGGNASYIEFENYQDGSAFPRTGITVIASAMNVDGGNGTVNGGDSNGNSYIYNYACYDSNLGENYDDGYVGGRIFNEVPFSARGGNGGTGFGGDAGYFEMYADMGYVVFGETGIENTADFDLSGGNGGTDGGDADYFYMEHYYAGGFPGVIDHGVVNRGNIYCRGGDAGTGTGGGNGWIEFDYYDNNNNSMFAPSSVFNSGTLICDGGNSLAGSGGPGGGCGNYVHNMTNIGSYSGHSGNGAVNGGDTNWYFEVYCDGLFVNSGSVNVSGGSGGTGDGGDSGYVYVETNRLSNTGSMYAVGGNTTTGTGGDSGYMDIWSTDAPSSISGCIFNVTRGTGGGGNGYQDLIYVDGFLFQGPVVGF